MQRTILTLITLGFVCLGTNAFAYQKVWQTNYQVLYSKSGSYESVREALEIAITDQGLVVSNVLAIGEMLNRTAGDVGSRKQVYKRSEILQFCSALLTRMMVEAEAGHIAFCPYNIYIYVTPDSPRKVYVGYRRPNMVGSPSSRRTLKKIDQLLATIVEDALSIE